jgi:hypothetical protein
MSPDLRAGSRRVPRAVVALAVAVALLGACSNAGQALDDFPLSAEEVARAVDGASPSQQPILADGIVTTAERERAYLAFIDCAQQGGVEVYGWELAPDGGDTFQTRLLSAASVPPSSTTIAGAAPPGAVEAPPSVEDQVINSCRHEQYTEVGLLYTFTHRLTGDDLRDWYDRIADCMRSKGVDVPSGATLDQMESIDRGLEGRCEAEEKP